MTYEQARQCMVVCKHLGVIVGWEGCRGGSHSFWVHINEIGALLGPEDTMVFSDYEEFMNWAEAYELVR